MSKVKARAKTTSEPSRDEAAALYLRLIDDPDEQAYCDSVRARFDAAQAGQISQAAQDHLAAMAHSSVSGHRDSPAPIAPDPAQFRYILVENPDGEAPRTRLFRSAESLAERLGALDGADLYVVMTWGEPLLVTRGPQRYLRLPGGTHAVTIPRYKGAPVRVVEWSLLEDAVALEDDGYLGPPALVTPPDAGEQDPRDQDDADDDADDPDDEWT